MNEIEPTASFFDFNPLAGEYDKWYKTAEGRQYDMLEKRALGRLIGKVESGEMDIHTLLDPYGKPTIKLCAFPGSIKTPPSIAGMADDFQAWLKITSGAFIAVRVDL